ncbi:MAG: nicotinamidase [Desulfuromonadales bacterium C00003107]|jgi:nicotinamidase/pyrazinamidase|nr:MAG: nicotinamidase [Desulfuromonadales bacterium C00003107]
MAQPQDLFRPGDALLVVDVQNDFCPGGALPIDQGNEVVAVLNIWIAAAQQQQVPIFLTRDWHPAGHPSFTVNGGPWPVHCLQDTSGAALHDELLTPAVAEVVTKGTRFDQDQLSAFDQTGLADKLRRDGIRRLWVGGLALDVCVLATVLDGCREGFEVQVPVKSCRPVTAEGGRAALEKMRQAGAVLVE